MPRLLEIAVAVQESNGKLSLDEELRRYIRLIRYDWVANWNCSVYSSSGVLDAVSDSLERLGMLDSYPSEFRRKVQRVAGDMDPAEYLGTLAELVRMADRQGAPEYGDLAMGSREFLQTFPYLFGFGAILTDEGDRDFVDLIRSSVTDEHPYCTERAVSYTTEAQRALVIFPGPDGMKKHLSWATRERLHEIIDTVNDHMQREHS
ncbi:hypothetical protein [Streptomyces sp. NBC_00342]|uniref:hypothetical protein n=1 Tax=Streptomyces sp. NBC_00342 TaxID=2975718 RepID=UPI002E27E006|nr:hypothetical protein [Streptomyces sp. NBC_00342]